ncbi:DUF4328 domain-containing protein [Streptomyces sp. DSM 44917]|uniref:DUF4328 domain-containing protein n=1 Tax=Streptomyces boetiae TaxID=3075541 RepID=A0ABU2LGE3_9ACTN|nr:DUF4328 domain-containing protein [Streptomyces sp. DSM 44917]MDT0310586.1 DUF4328 domain-containing protein [Streptomyces sp. DSM 44917]
MAHATPVAVPTPAPDGEVQAPPTAKGVPTPAPAADVPTPAPAPAEPEPQAAAGPEPPTAVPLPKLAAERRGAPAVRTGALTWLFWLLIACCTASAALLAGTFGYDGTAVGGGLDLWITLGTGLHAAHVAVSAALVVSWLRWFAAARRRAEALAPGRLRYRPWMAGLCWFLPMANLVLPKQIANDMWHAASRPSRSGGMAPHGRVNAWWGTALLLALPAAAPRLLPLDQPWDRNGGYELDLPLAVVMLASYAATVAAAVAALVFARRLSAMQRAALRATRR